MEEMEEEKGGGGSWDTHTHCVWWASPELMLLYALMSRGNTQDLTAPSYSFGHMSVHVTECECVCVRCLCFCLQVPECRDAWTHATNVNVYECVCVCEQWGGRPLMRTKAAAMRVMTTFKSDWLVNTPPICAVADILWHISENLLNWIKHYKHRFLNVVSMILNFKETHIKH